MKTAADYKSADEIRNDPEIPNIVKRARMVEEFTQLHAADLVPIPAPDADERRQFVDIVATLTAAKAEWESLEIRAKKLSVWLPAATEKLRILESETAPDASDAAIDEIGRLARRIQLSRAFEGGAVGVRHAINARTAAAFHSLNRLMQKFSAERFPKQFFLSGCEPASAITEALQTIGAIFKP